MTITELLSEVALRFKDNIIETITFRGEGTVLCKPSSIVALCRYLKSEKGFSYLVDICGADRLTEDDRFEVIYNVFNPNTKVRLRLKVRVPEETPVVETVTGIWRGANWFERETFDMYGVRFLHHPDLRRMYMPEDFEYFPLRKEYPLIGVPGSIPLPIIDPKANSREEAERYNRGESV